MRTDALRKCIRRGFTLVELLVVIGIIAVLIGILLPTLASARRSAGTVKCMAALREIGNSFRLYELDSKGFWPPSVHEKNHVRIPINVDRRWYDLIAKYITKTKVDTITDIDKIRASSVVWGCPEWSRIALGNLTSGDSLRPGYAMTIYTRNMFKLYPGGTSAQQTASRITDRNYIADGSTASGTADQGSYLKASRYAGKSSADAGIVADSMTHIIQIPSNGGLYDYVGVQTTGWQPGPPSDPYIVGAQGFFIDGLRHAKPGVRKSDRLKAINMLFCDGHVATVTVKEAWQALTGKAK